jgi:hypothetical protein
MRNLLVINMDNTRSLVQCPMIKVFVAGKAGAIGYTPVGHFRVH